MPTMLPPPSGESPPPEPRGSAGELADAVVGAFRRRFGRRPEVLARAPGRVVLLGAHVDYSEGWVLTGAIDRAVWVAAAPSTGSTIRVHSLDFDATATLDLERLPPPLADREDSSASWIDYPAGIIWALDETGHRPPAMDVAYGGNVPIGAGVSSSAAVEMAFLLASEALQERLAGTGFGLDGAARARLGMRCENGYMGVQSGIMDQFSSLHGAAGRLVFLDCRSLEYEHLALPATASVLIADSGVRRRLTDFGYNDRREECRQAVAILESRLSGIRTLRDVTPRDFELYSHLLPATLRRRARHAIEECRRVREGAEMLRHGDLAGFGRLIRQSHRSSRDLYEVSIPEIDVLATSAWAATGCHGARLLGGGFGGCVVALVETEAIEEVRAAMAEAFAQEFGDEPAIFTSSISDGAGIEPIRLQD